MSIYADRFDLVIIGGGAAAFAAATKASDLDKTARPRRSPETCRLWHAVWGRIARKRRAISAYRQRGEL